MSAFPAAFLWLRPFPKCFLPSAEWVKRHQIAFPTCSRLDKDSRQFLCHTFFMVYVITNCNPHSLPICHAAIHSARERERERERGQIPVSLCQRLGAGMENSLFALGSYIIPTITTQNIPHQFPHTSRRTASHSYS